MSLQLRRSMLQYSTVGNYDACRSMVKAVIRMSAIMRTKSEAKRWICAKPYQLSHGVFAPSRLPTGASFVKIYRRLLLSIGWTLSALRKCFECRIQQSMVALHSISRG